MTASATCSPPPCPAPPGRAGNASTSTYPAGSPSTSRPPPSPRSPGAVWQDRVVTLHYRRRDTDVRRTVHPYGLVLKAGAWYLLGLAGTDLRVYRADRITALDDAGEHFARDDGFDLAAAWSERAAGFVRGILRVLSPAPLRAIPVPPAAVTSSAVSSIVSGRPISESRCLVVRPVTYTVAPRAPSSTAMPRPAPRVAPATSATRPAKPCSMRPRLAATPDNRRQCFSPPPLFLVAVAAGAAESAT